MTADELLKSQIPNKRTELKQGMLVVREPAGYTHGRVTMDLTRLLTTHVEASGGGQLLAAGTGFLITQSPDTIRAPDIAFFRRERVPDPEPVGFSDAAPDLVVEVLSPEERPLEIQLRVGEWLSAGTQLVWVVDPRRGTVHVYRSDGTEEFVGPTGALNGEDQLPGFICPLDAIFERP